MLHIRNVDKIFPASDSSAEVQALKDFSLEIREGEFVSIIGPSGCGKSTILDIVAGLEPVTAGQVYIQGETINGPHTDIGVVFQQDATFPWLSNRQNVEFGLKGMSLSAGERKRRAQHALELVGVAEFGDHKPSQLSGGMRQRVNIARTLARRPKILLMDEPFGALDEQTRMRLGDELLDIWRNTDTTVIFITHSLSEAALLSDRVVVMTPRPGQIRTTLRTELPRERTYDNSLATEEFARLNAALWHELRDLQTA